MTSFTDSRPIVRTGSGGSTPVCAISSSSRSSPQVPTMEPWIVTALNTTTAGTTGVDPPIRPTDTILPPLRSALNPNANDSPVPTKSTTACTPPPVAFIRALPVSGLDGSTVCAAPASVASGHLAWSMSATIGEMPSTCLQKRTPDRPTPPAPRISTVSLGSIGASFLSAA